VSTKTTLSFTQQLIFHPNEFVNHSKPSPEPKPSNQHESIEKFGIAINSRNRHQNHAAKLFGPEHIKTSFWVHN
jgi:hypothetical protein